MLNTDATFIPGTEHATIAGIFRNCTGAWLLGFINQILVSNPLEAEIHALLLGLSLALEYKFLSLEINLDCQQVVNLLREMPNTSSSLISNWRCLLRTLGNPQVKHVYREQNKLADAMARKHAQNDATSVRPLLLWDPPTSIKDILRVDIFGGPTIRRIRNKTRAEALYNSACNNLGRNVTTTATACTVAPPQSKFELENLQKDLNKINKTKPAEDAIKRNIAEKKKIIEKKKADVKEIKANLDSKLETIGNIVHNSVPVSDDEGERQTEKGLKSHVDLINALSIADLTKGADVAGGRGYYLKGDGGLLNQALISFALHFMKERGYTLLQTPFFIRKDIMAKCAQLAQFDEELYKVTSEGENKYLIATAEQPLYAYHLEEHIPPSRLPYAGFSPCFRKEAGLHGRDTLGIFRVHQFEKVEQFCLTSPNGNDSWDMHEEIVRKFWITLFFTEYEAFKMKEKESLHEMMPRITTLINELTSLGKISEEEQVEKVLRVLPKSKWNVKVTAIREANKDLARMTLDELVGNLRTYEMEVDGTKEQAPPEEVFALKASNSDEESELDKEQVAFITKNFSKFFKKNKGTSVKR
ncbi:hypothetical protein BC332_23135 [Capsicum chinense]|nr:hypothetical protein BC332_23135 [Capsicum chinense]